MEFVTKPKFVISSFKSKRLEHLCCATRSTPGRRIRLKFVNRLVDISGTSPSVWGRTNLIWTLLEYLPPVAPVNEILATICWEPTRWGSRDKQSPSLELTLTWALVDSRPSSPRSLTARATHRTLEPGTKYTLSRVTWSALVKKVSLVKSLRSSPTCQRYCVKLLSIRWEEQIEPVSA